MRLSKRLGFNPRACLCVPISRGVSPEFTSFCLSPEPWRLEGRRTCREPSLACAVHAIIMQYLPNWHLHFVSWGRPTVSLSRVLTGYFAFHTKLYLGCTMKHPDIFRKRYNCMHNRCNNSNMDDTTFSLRIRLPSTRIRWKRSPEKQSLKKLSRVEVFENSFLIRVTVWTVITGSFRKR